jgi:hypothetical protein
VDAAIALLIALINNAQQVSNLIAQARSEDRDVTDDELNALFTENDQALATARAQVEAARGFPPPPPPNPA